MTNCAVNGGCISDYIAISISIRVGGIMKSTGSLASDEMDVLCNTHTRFHVLEAVVLACMIQVFASFNLLLSLVDQTDSSFFSKMALNFLKETFLPPVRSNRFLPLILLPWIASAACKIPHVNCACSLVKLRAQSSQTFTVGIKCKKISGCLFFVCASGLLDFGI
ncbi:hypothetical protein Leryth_009914 [Lithospermum erythrorhizon]|nr:hypothetical protein Leryth_009914 [Lithospermum erythrorhizon]